MKDTGSVQLPTGTLCSHLTQHFVCRELYSSSRDDTEGMALCTDITEREHVAV